eukprot:3826719-Pyramimonas_sp.AAC.1
MTWDPTGSYRGTCRTMSDHGGFHIGPSRTLWAYIQDPIGLHVESSRNTYTIKYAFLQDPLG